jgi:hypothetical protein
MSKVDLLGDDWREPKDPRGRKAHKPRDEQKATVEALAGYGVPHEEIAQILRIDATTLRKRYRDQLDRGQALANAKVAQNLFGIATGSGREAVTAAVFWLRCRAGWSEYTPAPRAQREPELGKKAAAAVAAETADHGTGWSGLVN